MNYSIRRRERNDCKDISHVVAVSWNETYKGIVSDEFLNDLYNNEERNASNSFINFNEDNNHQFVLEIGGKVVGFVKVGDSNWNDCGELCAIYILKKYKGLGFGRKLFDAGVNELKKMGFNKMIVGCLKGNPSNEFYKHMGGNLIKTRNYERLNLPENVYLFDKI